MEPRRRAASDDLDRLNLDSASRLHETNSKQRFYHPTLLADTYRGPRDALQQLAARR